MALFGSKKKETDTSSKDESVQENRDNKSGGAAEGRKASLVPDTHLEDVLRGPRITEKATMLVEDENTYVFDVAPNANKQEVAKAVKEIYDVEPIDVRTVKVPSKSVRRRGIAGTTSAGKKAYVKLAEGDTIELI